MERPAPRGHTPNSRLAHAATRILTDLNIGPFSINFNNRKVLQGFYEGLGITDPIAVIQAADKLDKIGEDGVADILTRRLRLTDEQTRACLDLAGIRGTDSSIVEQVKDLGSKSDLLTEGLQELAFVLDSLADLPQGSIRADLSIARGLDYYTGTVYEGKLLDYPTYGSICSGGRYENLAGTFIHRNLPDIGISIGLTRIFAKLLAEGKLLVDGTRKCPSDVLVVVPNNKRAALTGTTAATLRSRGLKAEVYHQADKLRKQIRYASRKGIPFVWFPPFEDGKAHKVKDMTSGEQTAADPDSWVCPALI